MTLNWQHVSESHKLTDRGSFGAAVWIHEKWIPVLPDGKRSFFQSIGKAEKKLSTLSIRLADNSRGIIYRREDKAVVWTMAL